MIDFIGLFKFNSVSYLKVSFLLWGEQNVHSLIKLGKWVIILNVCLHLAIINVDKHVFVPLMFEFF